MRKKMVIIALLLVIATLISTSCTASLTITTTSAPTSVISPTSIPATVTVTTTLTPTPTQPTSIPIQPNPHLPKFTFTSAVTSVTASVDPTSYSGPGPKSFTFSAVITVNGPCIVTYKWERSDHATGPTQTITFDTAGSQTVTYTWTSISVSPYSGWGRIHILTPNDMTSNQANFTLSIIP